MQSGVNAQLFQRNVQSFFRVKDTAPSYETKFLSDCMSYPSQRYCALSQRW
jgi:hypothetical protein